MPAYTRADALIDVAPGYVEAGPADTSGEDRDIVVIQVSVSDLHAATAQTPSSAGDVPAGTPHPTGATIDPAHVADADADPDPDAGLKGGDASNGAPLGQESRTTETDVPTAWIESVGAVAASTAARVACTGLLQVAVTDDTTGEVFSWDGRSGWRTGSNAAR